MFDDALGWLLIKEEWVNPDSDDLTRFDRLAEQTQKEEWLEPITEEIPQDPNWRPDDDSQ